MDKQIIYCQKCHQKKRFNSYEKAILNIESQTGYKVKDMCVSTCGLGKKQFFAQIDDDLITANTFESLIEQIKEY